MAKSVKKSANKVAKKASGKASVSAKAKKVTKAKASSKKVVAKPAKKAPKVVAKKEVTKKVVVKAVPAKKIETGASAPKPQHNLNIFPALTQRPIAHKPKATAPAADEKTRYSDEELKEFETLIKGKLENSREEFKILKETLNRNNDAGTDSTSGSNAPATELSTRADW